MPASTTKKKAAVSGRKSPPPGTPASQTPEPLLGRSKTEIDQLMGSSLLAKGVLGIGGETEKAYQYDAGDFSLIIGFLDGIARYMAVTRSRGPLTPLSPAEMASALSLNAPATTWKKEVATVEYKKPSKSKKTERRTSRPTPPTTYFTHVTSDSKDKKRVVREMLGWTPGGQPYAFFYLPNLPGSFPVMPSEWGVQAALG